MSREDEITLNGTSNSGVGTRRQKVLIVDDRPENLFTLERILSSLDVDIVKATSGNEALAATLNHDFAVAILDVMMPEMNGYELAEHLRGDRNTQVLPILFLTASFADEGQAFQGYAAGGVDYIVKPYPPEVLLAKLRVFLEIDRYRRNIEGIVEERTQRVRHLNAVLRSIRRVNQLIVTVRKRAQLLQPVCDALIQTRGFLGAWCVLTDRLPEHIEGAHAGFTNDKLANLFDMFKNKEPPPCCGQVNLEVPIVVRCDRDRNCSDCPLSEAFPGTASLTVSLVSRERHYGYLTVCVPIEFAHDVEEHDLLLEIAGDVAFALCSMETEEARDASERTLRAIFSAAKDGILLADAESRRLVMTNDEMCRMLGYTHDEMQQLSVADIHPPQEHARIDKKFAQQLRGEGTLAMDVPVLRRDGSVFYADINAVPIELSGRTHMLGIFRDISERRQYEEGLRKIEEKYRLLADNTVDCIWLMNLDTTFRYLNPASFALLGYTPEEMLGTRLEAYCDADNLRVMTQVIEEQLAALPNLEPIMFEAHLRKRNGKKIPVEITGRVIVDDAGNPLLLQGVTRDISERRSLEAQLREAQKMEAIGQLAGGVAHDFNNILQVITGYCTLLAEFVEVDSEAREFLKEISGSADRAAGLTRQLLAFSRRQTLELEDLNLQEVCQGILKMVRRIIGETIRVELEESAELKTVRADWGQMEQVLMNLCVNARDAMPEGGTLTIATENVELDHAYCAMHDWARPGRYVMLTVSDSGCGMDEDTLHHVFEPFFTTKEQGKGTGLGLAMVYGVVRQHNGMVHVYSEVGQGTTFRIYLPTIERTAQAKKRQATGPVIGGHETILLAEDDAALQTLTRRILEHAGYTVLVAGDGEEAVHLFDTHAAEISLVLADVVMPRGGATSVYETLRSRDTRMGFLFTSGYTSNAIQEKFLTQESIPFLQKPYGPEALLRKVRAVIDAVAAEEAS